MFATQTRLGGRRNALSEVDARFVRETMLADPFQTQELPAIPMRELVADRPCDVVARNLDARLEARPTGLIAPAMNLLAVTTILQREGGR
jgi:hypothetical protein